MDSRQSRTVLRSRGVLKNLVPARMKFYAEPGTKHYCGIHVGVRAHDYLQLG
jgi:hypothetical protein